MHAACCFCMAAHVQPRPALRLQLCCIAARTSSAWSNTTLTAATVGLHMSANISLSTAGVPAAPKSSDQRIKTLNLLLLGCTGAPLVA